MFLISLLALPSVTLATTITEYEQLSEQDQLGLVEDTAYGIFLGYDKNNEASKAECVRMLFEPILEVDEAPEGFDYVTWKIEDRKKQADLSTHDVEAIVLEVIEEECAAPQ
ncbi:MAG: hypothetical protein AB7S71_01840 [Dongiaceae bacterium]